jgi:hypothetical protein
MLTTPRRLLGIALLATGVLAGCDDDDDPTDPGADAPGTYQLTLVNGDSPPATVEILAGGGRIEITGGTFVIRDDGTYTETINTRTVQAGGASVTDTQSESGTYITNGETIMFTIAGTATEAPFSYEGTISGGTLSYTFLGTAVVYQR